MSSHNSRLKKQALVVLAEIKKFTSCDDDEYYDYVQEGIDEIVMILEAMIDE